MDNKGGIELKCLQFFCELEVFGRSKNCSGNIKIEKIDWDLLLKLAFYHKVVPLCNLGIQKWEEKDLIPANILAEFKLHQTRITLNNLRNLKELLKIIKVLRAEDVEVIPYKGNILGLEAYGGLSKRQGGDIDFFFKKKDFDTIIKILEKEGYKEKINIPEFYKDTFLSNDCEFNLLKVGGDNKVIALDFHWKLAPSFYQLELTFDHFQKLTTIEKYHEIFINKLTPEGLILNTCLHHVGKEKLRIFKYLFDLVVLYNRFEDNLDWTFIINKSKEWKAFEFLALGFGIIYKLYNVNLPREILEAVRRPKINKQIEKTVRNYYTIQPDSSSFSIFQLFMQNFWFQLLFRESYTIKLKILYHSLIVILTPSLRDIAGNNTSKNRFNFRFLTKPFRLIKENLFKE